MDYRAKIFTPTVNLRARDPQYALYGHILALVAGALSVLFAILMLLSNFVNALLLFIFGLFVLIIELDQVRIPPLKDSQIRGIIWLILGIFSFSSPIAAIAMIISGVLYLAYAWK